jgi:hypothetical protein
MCALSGIRHSLRRRYACPLQARSRKFSEIDRRDQHDDMDCEEASTSSHDKECKKPKTAVTAKDIAALLANHLTCSICHDWLAGAHALTCGHMFCGICLASWLTQKQSCPECRKPTTGRSVRSHDLLSESPFIKDLQASIILMQTMTSHCCRPQVFPSGVAMSTIQYRISWDRTWCRPTLSVSGAGRSLHGTKWERACLKHGRLLCSKEGSRLVRPVSQDSLTPTAASPMPNVVSYTT